MAAGTQVVSNDAERKVEIDEKCVGDPDMNDLSNVGGNSNGDGKDESDDLSYVFVSGGDPGDTGGGVGVDDVTAISGSADEVYRFNKEESGLGNGGVVVDPLVLETNAVGDDSLTVSDAVVKAVIDDVDIENGSAVDRSVVMETSVIGQDVNGEVVKSNDELADAKEIADVEAKTDDVVSAVTFDLESTVNTTETSQVTDFDPESISNPLEESKSQVTITQSLSVVDVVNTSDELLSIPNQVQNADCEVMVNDELKSIRTVINETECQATVDGSGKPSEDLEGQVIADGSESSESPIMEREAHVTVDRSGKLSEGLECQKAADGSESSGSTIEEQKVQVTVDGSESTGSLVDNQEHPPLLDDSEPIGDNTKEVDSSTIVTESDVKSEEHQELLIKALEVNVEEEPNRVCGGIKAEHKSESVSASYPSENKKAGGSNIGSGTESELYPDSGLVLSEDTGALVDGQVEKLDGILEMGETQLSGIESYESEPLLLNADEEKPEEKLEKQVEESSERFVKITESEELMVDFEVMTEQDKIENDIQESRTVVIDNVQDDLNLEDNTAESANETDVSSETVTNIEPITHENTVSHCEVSNCIDKPQDGFRPEESPENVETLDPVKSECKTGELLVEQENDSLSNPDDLTVVEQKAEPGAHLVTENRAAEGINFETGIENVDVPDDEEKETAVKDSPVEFVPDLVTENRSAECMDSQTGIENFDVPDDEEKETEAKDTPVRDHKTSSYPDTIMNPASVIEFGSFGRHETIPNVVNDVNKVPDVINGDIKSACGADSDNLEQNVDGSHTDRNSDKRSSVEGSVSDAIDVQNEEGEVLAYNFLIKIPRFEDESFREEIRSAQSQVTKKTSLRDAIRVEVLEKRDMLRGLHEAFNAALSDENKARRLVKSKRQEIDSVLAVINRWKNAMSVEDIDNRILSMEHMIQHETIQLKDEKQFIREIKQLKSLRDHLASNMGSPEEIRQAIDQKDQNEERLKTLRKELDALKDKVSKAEEVVKAVQKKYEEEHDREREMQIQFRAADGVRQQAYAHLNSLKKLSYDKNQHFRQFKEDLAAARRFHKCGDKDSLHRLCAYQVETFMEQWNNDDEFRKEYASRWIMNASRRQRALDGGSLVHDDVSPALPSKVNQKVDTSLVPIPIEVKSLSVFSAVEQGKVVSLTENKHAEDSDRSIENISGKKNQTLKSKGPAKSTSRSEVATVTELAVVTEAMDNRKEEENTLTKEEIELARKAEELKKEEIEAKLKEQRRLEEKAKAMEALERKKRNAEKAQIRAELRARKEAEQKEKEREKRLRKKEKKAGGDGSINGEDAASSESSTEATAKELESVSKEQPKKKTHKPPPHFFSKQLKPKPLPPPLLNKHKKVWQQYVKMSIAAVALLGLVVLFLVGNGDYYVNLKFTKYGAV